MLKSYLLTTFRNLSLRKGFSLLNICGLAIGLASSLLISQYVQDELSYDTFHKNADRIYRVRYDFYRDGEQVFKSATAFPRVGPSLKEEFPEVEDYCRLYLRYGGEVIRYGDVSVKENNLFQADASFFSMFSYQLIAGDPETALKEPRTAVVEQETARRFFGDEDPIGKRIKVGLEEEYEITGVAVSPENSHLKFSFLFSYPTLTALWGDDFNTAWGWYDFYNYIRLAPGADPEALSAKLPAFIDKYSGEENESDRVTFVLQPLKQIHLYSNLIQEARVNGNGESVYFLMIIALVIVVIAWVNYINLSTARAIERAKEVGIRKSIGADRRQLITQFLGEAFLINLFASLLGLAIVYTVIPTFNTLAGKHLTTSIFQDQNLWLALGVLYLGGSLLAGVYPALVLSSYHPVKVLKGAMSHSREGLLLRKGLVIFQFSASVILIAGTITVYRQLSFMQNQDLGIDIDHVLAINAPDIVAYDSLYPQLQLALKNEVLTYTPIKSFTATTQVPGNLIYWTNGARSVQGGDEQNSTIMYRVGADYDYFKTFDIDIIAGRAYAKEFVDTANVILNKKAVDVLKLGTPDEAVGKQIVLGRDTLTVIGVTENYHQEGLKEDFRQTAFHLREATRGYFCLRIESDKASDILPFLKTKFGEFFPDNPFNYFFLDSFFNSQYQREEQFGKVFGFFSLLAIFVACLGLFGLASFTVAQRRKEIGIRKVMGSSVGNIFVLLSKDFLMLIAVANVIAVPVVWWIMDHWLEGFAFRIEIGAGVFLVACVVTVFIGLVTVSYQSIAAAVVNPIKSLRSE